MKINTMFEIYEIIAGSTKGISSRKQSFGLRKRGFEGLNKIIKVAFDTRRIDQETTYNPRRGLQNYHRSEPFISKQMKQKIEAFTRLSLVLENIKLEYGKEPEWQDSYVRVLHASVQKGLRTKQGDNDFSDAQPSMGSLDYLDELIYVRYRLTSDDLMTMAEQDLKEIILNKDEVLSSRGIFHNNAPMITSSDVNRYSYDHLMEKMFVNMAQVMSQMKPADDLTTKLFDVKATKDNPIVERTVNITIKDSLPNQLEITKNSSENDHVDIDDSKQEI